MAGILLVLVAQVVSGCLTIFLVAVSIVVAEAGVEVITPAQTEFSVGTAVMVAVDEAQSEGTSHRIRLLSQGQPIQAVVVVADRGQTTVMVVLAVLA